MGSVSPILDLARALTTPVLVGLVGRVWLSVLPAGSIGGHAPKEWARTCAFSLATGALALAAGWNLLRCFGVDSPLSVLLGFTVLAAVLRLLALPGAMVPRREVADPPATWNGRILLGLSIATALWSLVELLRQGTSSAPVALVLDDRRGALAPWLELCRVLHGELRGIDLRVFGWCLGVAAWIALLECGRVARAPVALTRALLLLGWFSPHLRTRIESADVEAALAVLLLSVAWASAVRWLRRADARARLLAAGGLAGLVVLRLEWSTFAACVAVGIGLAGARPQVRPWFTTVLGFLMFVATPAAFLGRKLQAMPQVARPFGLESWARGTLGLGPLGLVLCIAAGLLALRYRSSRPSDRWTPAREFPLASAIFLLALVAWTQIVAGVHDVALILVSTLVSALLALASLRARMARSGS